HPDQPISLRAGGKRLDHRNPIVDMQRLRHSPPPITYMAISLLCWQQHSVHVCQQHSLHRGIEKPYLHRYFTGSSPLFSLRRALHLAAAARLAVGPRSLVAPPLAVLPRLHGTAASRLPMLMIISPVILRSAFSTKALRPAL